MVKISIIVAYYQVSNGSKDINRLLDSLREQSFKDFEVIMVHDGSPLVKIEYNTSGLDVKFFNTEKRENVWGHNCRNLGISKASGDILMFTNGDNVYNKDILNVINKELDDSYIYIFPIRMRGMVKEGNKLFYPTYRNSNVYVILKGIPVVYGNIDVMQFVAKKEVWKDGWYDLSEGSDGNIFPELSKKYKTKWVPYIIGDHY